MGVWPTERNEIEEVVMAKVIEFYVPKNFRRTVELGTCAAVRNDH
jgi:hypothetical protein